ncbi:MAG: hypothetical protein IK081_11190 [Lachnospiraceae bacterium]|nr:hypothetical protein [Lachnospiraceae bacterium]
MMVNQSEQILNAFSENYFYKEIILSDLKYCPVGQSEKELADLIFVLGKYVLAIQLKARNSDELTNDIGIEEKWLKNKCKLAKKQVKNTILEIKNGRLPQFINNRCQKVLIDPSATIVPVVMFVNPMIKNYSHVLPKNSEDGLDVNCISYDDFREVCAQLITPMEIVEYFIWRKECFKNYPNLDLLFVEDDESISISRPMKAEASVVSFIHEKYGYSVLNEEKEYLDAFRNLVMSLQEKLVKKTTDDACLLYVQFFSCFSRIEVRAFMERLERAKTWVRLKRRGVVGSLRSDGKDYTVFFVVSEGERISIDYLEKISETKGKHGIIAEIVVYRVGEEDLGIDYFLKYCS